MKIKMHQVDAFTDKVFGGNPAAICLLDRWLTDETMQSIATENNLPETAFLVASGEDYLLRWFTPAKEVDLCGHATLASAYVVFNHLKQAADQVKFHSLSGILTVKRDGREMMMDFPALPLTRVDAPQKLVDALKFQPMEVYRSTDYVIVAESAHQLRTLNPDLDLLSQLDLRGVCITARGDEAGIDFVSRFFAPKLGIPEDPITGSAHCALVPFWSDRLKKNSFQARQLTARNVTLRCRLNGDRVQLFGEAAHYFEGFISIVGRGE
jgi:PhzF family phenazine biosynthesis protein